jgi:hypothetical protein
LQATLPIAKTVFWASESFLKDFSFPHYHFVEPDVSFLPLMQRRRLNSLNKIFFHLVNECEPKDRSLPIVFGSRFGELQRTLKILQSLGAKEQISPTDFSHSVNNTHVALYSIFTKNQQAANAISAGEDSLIATLFETASQFHTEDKDIIFVFVEDKLPAPYTLSKTEEAEYAYGLAMLVSSTKPQMTLSWEKTGQAKKPKFQPAAFFEGLFHQDSQFRLNAFGNELLFHKEIHA